MSGDTKAVWSAGDFSKVAAGQVIVGELLCEAVDLHARERVLDVATGSGNAALSAARRRCEVTGIDLVPALLERARARAAAEELRVTFVEGDATRLPMGAAAFDCALSTFGTMFADDGAAAARELARVVRPGGRIGLACWTPEGFPGVLFALLDRYVAPSPGRTPPTIWGTEAGLRGLFGTADRFSAQPRMVRMRGDSPDAYLAGLRRVFGPIITTFARLDPAQQEKLTEEILAMLRHHNEAVDGTVSIPGRYLEAVIARAP